MSTVSPCLSEVNPSVLNRGVCFAILCDADNERLSRVYEEYIKPACEAGYRAQGSNELFVLNVTDGVTNALSWPAHGGRVLRRTTLGCRRHASDWLPAV